jgi:hypothetical protein
MCHVLAALRGEVRYSLVCVYGLEKLKINHLIDLPVRPDSTVYYITLCNDLLQIIG